MVKIFIGGFPLDMDEMQLAQLVAPHGNISTLKIVRDKATKKCKGYAFMEMETEEDAVNTMAALDGEMLGDRELSVRLAEDKTAAPAAPARYERVARQPDALKKKRPRRPS